MMRKKLIYTQLIFIFLCSFVFANSVSDISLVSGGKGHLIHIKAVLEDAKVSYELRNGGLAITVKSPSITKQDFYTSKKQFDADFLASSMQTNVDEGVIRILLREYKLPIDDILIKQNENGILIYLGSNSSNNNVESRAETEKKEAPKKRTLRNDGNAHIDSVAMIGRDGHFSLYLYGEFPTQIKVLPSDSGFTISYPGNIIRSESLGNRYNFSKESVFSSVSFSDSSLFVKIKKGNISPLFVSSIPSGVAVYFKDNRQLSSNLISAEKIHTNVSSAAIFVDNPNGQQNGAGSNIAETILFVSRNRINLRRSPSSNAEIAQKANAGDRLIAIKKEGGWYAVKNQNGEELWVHEDVVNIGAQFAETKSPAAAQNANTKTQRTQDGHYIVTDGEYVINTADRDRKRGAQNTRTQRSGDEHYIVTDGEYIINTADRDRKRGAQNNANRTFNNYDVLGQNTIQILVDSSDAQTPYEKIYIYHRKGRDPFLPLDKSDFIREGLPSINNIILVGILYDQDDAVALFEERKATTTISFSMKIGDPVINGKLLRIEPDKAVFLMRESTFSYTVEKELNFN